MRDESKANELEDRLIAFAVRVIKLANVLPRSRVGRHLSDQLLRSGTAPAPNYAEARGAESRADFVHKLKVAVKELHETRVWLRIIGQAHVVKPSRLEALMDENNQLCRIMSVSITTVKQRPSNEDNSEQ